MLIRLRVVIVDEDTEYLEGISHYMTFCCEGQFYVSSFDKKERLNSYIEKMESRNDILLISDELFERDWFVLLREKFQKIFLLSSFELKNTLGDKLFVDEGHNQISVLDKYQSIELIRKEIVSTVFNGLKGAVSVIKGDNTSKCISLFSAHGGSGKTFLAIMCCIIASQRGERALYINLEKINSGEAYFSSEKSKGLSEIIYHIKSKKRNLSTVIGSFIMTDREFGFDYISPVENIEEIWSLNPDEIDFLINEIRRLKIYNYIFVDLSSVLDEGTKQVLISSNKTVLLLSPDYNCLTKTKTLLHQRELQKQRNDKDFLTDFIIVRNKCKCNNIGMHDLAEGIEGIESLEQVTIPYINEIEAYTSGVNQLKKVILINNNQIATHIGTLLDAI